MANKKISELPYISNGDIGNLDLVPLVTYFTNNNPSNNILFGWGTLSTVSTRTYGTFFNSVGNGALGYRILGKELNKPTNNTAVKYIQSIIDIKFRNNDIRNNYSKYNKNIFDIKKSAEQAAAELAKNTLNP